SAPPVRLLSKAIRLPSGEKAGSRSLIGPWLTWTRFDPSGSAVTMRAFGATHAKPPFAMGVAAWAELTLAPVTSAASTQAHRHGVIVHPSPSTLCANCHPLTAGRRMQDSRLAASVLELGTWQGSPSPPR